MTEFYSRSTTLRKLLAAGCLSGQTAGEIERIGGPVLASLRSEGLVKVSHGGKRAWLTDRGVSVARRAA